MLSAHISIYIEKKYELIFTKTSFLAKSFYWWLYIFIYLLLDVHYQMQFFSDVIGTRSFQFKLNCIVSYNIASSGHEKFEDTNFKYHIRRWTLHIWTAKQKYASCVSFNSILDWNFNVFNISCIRTLPSTSRMLISTFFLIFFFFSLQNRIHILYFTTFDVWNFSEILKSLKKIVKTSEIANRSWVFVIAKTAHLNSKMF